MAEQAGWIPGVVGQLGYETRADIDDFLGFAGSRDCEPIDGMRSLAVQALLSHARLIRQLELAPPRDLLLEDLNYEVHAAIALIRHLNPLDADAVSAVAGHGPEDVEQLQADPSCVVVADGYEIWLTEGTWNPSAPARLTALGAGRLGRCLDPEVPPYEFLP